MFITGATLLAVVVPLAWTTGNDSEDAVDEEPLTPSPSLRGNNVPTTAPTAFFYETDELGFQTLVQEFADKEFYMSS